MFHHKKSTLSFQYTPVPRHNTLSPRVCLIRTDKGGDTAECLHTHPPLHSHRWDNSSTRRDTEPR